MRTWMDVAVLAKPKNLDGRLAVHAAAGLPFVLEPGDEVAFVPPRTDLPRRAVVAEVQPVDERAARVRFEGVDGTAARGLVGCHCLVRRELLDGQLLGEEPALWTGWTLVDEQAGPVGEVSGLVENPGQALLEVARPDGAAVLVPVVDDIVVEVDPDAAIVRTRLPKGLLDL